MKRFLFQTALIFSLALFFNACQDETYVSFTGNSPVYMSYEDLRDAVQVNEVRAMENPGKIYFKDDYIFINEHMEGIHVYDNSDPVNPEALTFIEIPGNVDIAIRDHYLYADSYIDLVVIDIADLMNPVEIDREKDIFEYTLPEYDEDYELASVDEEKGVVIDWEIKKVRERVSTQQYNYPVFWDVGFAEDASTFKRSGVPNTMSGSEFGVGGSMARFGQYEDYLLVMKNSWTVTTFETETNGHITEGSTWNAGWNIETMFIREHTMFIGSQNGMFIFDIEHLPEVTQLSTFLHFTACDPVVADEQFAYITLRSGGNCGRGRNVLEVVDISDLTEPKLKRTYEMTGPNGLGIDGDVLFVCDGDAGLKVFDAAKPDDTLPLLAHFSEIHTFDVIPLGEVLFMIGENGFYQYDYTDLTNITLFSTIEVQSNEE